MRAVGITCGVGTLLRVARDAGCEIVGNVEPRSQFRTVPWIWDANFPGVPVDWTKGEHAHQAAGWVGADLALGHPPCGRHSTLGDVHSLDLSDEERAFRKARRAADVGLLPLFAQLVNRLEPKVFALDNLPKILAKVAPREWWERSLPKYRLTFFTITNWDYGSCQRRVRLWIVGVRGKRPFTFRPIDERPDGPRNAWDAIADLPWEPWRDVPALAHVHLQPDQMPGGCFWDADLVAPRRKIETATELALGYVGLPPEHAWPYRTRTDRIAMKIGRSRCDPRRDIARTVSGDESRYHPLTGWALTPRERARLMGWPDDFHLPVAPGGWSRPYLHKLVKVTGKGVPSEFPTYLIPQLMRHARRM